MSRLPPQFIFRIHLRLGLITTKINSQDAQSAKWWSWNYTLIKYANTVIGGVENKYAVLSADEKRYY